MFVFEIVEIDDKFGVGGDFEISGDFANGSSIKFGGAVDIEKIVMIGRGGKGSNFVF